MRTPRTQRRRGVTVIELLTVIVVISVAMAMGFLLFRSMRRAARVATAEARLKQVSAGLELYFRDHQGYPPEGSDLTVELRPYIKNPAIFDNPLSEDDKPGDDLNDFYREPALADIDRPGTYVVCFPPGSTGDPVIVLETGDRITRRGSPGGDVDSFQRDSLITFLYQEYDVVGGDGGDETDDGLDAPPSLPADPPDTEESPDDYTTETASGYICISETHDCLETTVEVVDTDLTFGEGDGEEVPIYVDVNLVSGVGDAPVATWPLADGEAVTEGDEATLVLKASATITLTFTADFGTWQLVTTSDGDPQAVLTLRQGDRPTEFDPYTGETKPINPRLQPYIDPVTGVVTIEPNQVLYLVEFSNTTFSSETFDLQDLIVLMTLTEPPTLAECEDAVSIDDLPDDETAPPGDDDDAEPPADPARPVLAMSLITLTSGGSDDGTSHTGGTTGKLRGQLNLNPSNNDDYEFILEKPDGTRITRDDLHASNGDLSYTGPAVMMRFRPKGNGNQNSITFDGTSYSVRNGTLYTIYSSDLTVHLYNDKADKPGKAMGRWWVDSMSAESATIVGQGDGVVSGKVNLNPSNNDDFEFILEKPDGTRITRDDLHASRGDLEYTGPAVMIRFRPKGNGNQNTLVVDGEVYRVSNGTLYTIRSSDLEVHLYNEKAENNGHVMGHWWLETTGTATTVENDGGTGGSSWTDTSYIVRVTNEATADKDVAKNVRLAAEVTEGAQFVERVVFLASPDLGDIAPGASKETPVEIETLAAWETAYGQTIGVVVSVENEDNWPEQNEGKSISIALSGPEEPQPVLSISPDNVRTKSTNGHAFQFRNGAGQHHHAIGVRYSVSVVKGAQYVQSVQYNGDVGAILGDGSQESTISVSLKNSTWREAQEGAEVQFLLTITGEGNNPDANVGKTATYTIYK